MLFDFFNFARDIVSPSKTSRMDEEQRESYSDPTITTAEPYTTDVDTTHQQSVPRHRYQDDDLALGRASRTEELARSSRPRREPKRERSRDSYYDGRDAASSDMHGSTSRRDREGKKDRRSKESRKYGKDDIRALLKDKEALQLQLSQTISHLAEADDAGRRMKQKLRKTEEDLQLAQREAEATNQLRAQLDSQYRHGQSMDAKIRQQTAELSALKEQLRRTEANNSQTNQLLDVRTAELKGAQVFLTKADAFAGADLIKMVESLNSEMFQGAAFMSEELEFDDIAGRNEKVDKRTMERARGLLSSVMFSLLLAKPPKVDPLPLQLALQSVMVMRCEQIIQTLCPMEHRDHGNFLRKIYTGIQASEEQAVAGRWRAMTLAQLKSSPAYAPYISEDLVSVLIVCGLSTSSAGYQTIIQDIQHRMSLLEEATLKLRAALKEGVTSVDIEPLYISSKTQFDPLYMDDAYGDSRRQTGNRRNGEHVMCTTDLGLRRVVRRTVDGQVQTYYDAILKPKVVLASSLTEEAEAQSPLSDRTGGVGGSGRA